MEWWNSSEISSIMSNYVHDERLVGPYATEKIEHEAARRILFEYYDRVYSDNRMNSAFIVGRRGSGKTAYLSHLEGSESFDLVIKIDQEKAIQDTIRWLSKKSQSFYFVEEISSYWDSIFYTLIAAEIMRCFPKFTDPDGFLGKYVSGLGVRSSGNAAGFIKRLLNRVEETLRTRAVSGDFRSALFIDFIDSIDDPGEYLKFSVNKLCETKKIRIAILLDSLEDYHLDVNDVRSSLEGFLKTAGKYDSCRFLPQIKCCMPSELYYYFMGLSTNVGKDFSQPLLLHWRSNELLSVVAHRMHIHMRLYGEGNRAHTEELLRNDVSTKDGVREFFFNAFQGNVVNEAGHAERPELYVLRHTQMLPRQVLKIFDAIIRRNLIETGEYSRILPRHVTGGVDDLVNELAVGVCGAYRFLYPNAWNICREIVGRLPHVFTRDQLEAAFNRHLKKYNDIGTCLDEGSFYRMLTEIGFLGEVRDETDHYIKCQFEYNSRGELTQEAQARLCVHPMFRGPNGNRSCASQYGRVVYPIGVDPNELPHHN